MILPPSPRPPGSVSRALAVVAVVLLGLAPAPRAETNVRILLDGPSPAPQEFIEAFRVELLDLLGDEFGVALPPDHFVEADWTVGGVNRILDEALADPKVDLIIGLGFVVSHELTQRTDLPKPVIAPFVPDPAIQGAPLVDGRSGVRNLSYVTYTTNVLGDLELFRRIAPFRRLVVLMSESVREIVPELEARVRQQTAALGLEIEVVVATTTAATTLAAIPADAEAVYVGALMRMSEAELDKLAAGLVERKLPSFALLGRTYVVRGFLAGQTTDSQVYRLARRTALNAQRILLGEDAGDLPVRFASSNRLALNMATARAIGVSPPWAVLTSAERIDTVRTDVARVLSLQDAVQEALAANRSLAAAEQAVLAGEASVGVARAPLLPRVDLFADGSWVRPELARNSFGRQAERSVAGTASLTQLLYADDAWAGYGVEKHLQTSREADRDGTRLDIAQLAATAYLNVLVAKTLERIQIENLEKTRVNLELARARESIGQSSPGEVYRWEGEIANRQIDVIQVNAERNAAEIQLNRLLHRPLEESYRTEDVDLLDPSIAVSDPRLARYLQDPASFRILREFMARVALENSPEIRALDGNAAAQDRVLTSTGRAFWLPSVGVSGEVTQTWLRDGEGADPVDPFPAPLDTEWFVGLRASYPLLEGGAKVALRREAQRTLDQIRREREALAESIEQRLRTALHRAGASYASIALARDASAAADRNFRLVQDSYSQGAVSIVDLIEAQNNALVSESQAASSIYGFLVDLMEVERAAGYLSVLSTPEARAGFVEDLEMFRAAREQAAEEDRP